MNKSELVDLVAERTGVSKKDVAASITGMLDVVAVVAERTGVSEKDVAASIAGMFDVLADAVMSSST